MPGDIQIHRLVPLTDTKISKRMKNKLYKMIQKCKAIITQSDNDIDQTDLIQVLIAYLLHASHDSLGHVGATKLYHFLKQLYYFKGMRKKLHQYVRSCNKCKIMNLQKPRFIDLHQDIVQTPHDHLSIDLLGPYNTTS